MKPTQVLIAIAVMAAGMLLAAAMTLAVGLGLLALVHTAEDRWHLHLTQGERGRHIRLLCVFVSLGIAWATVIFSAKRLGAVLKRRRGARETGRA